MCNFCKFLGKVRPWKNSEITHGGPDRNNSGYRLRYGEFLTIPLCTLCLWVAQGYFKRLNGV